MPDLSRLSTLACLLEATAPKPGNVSPGRPFRDMTYEDFLVSALAIGPEMGRAGQRSLGEVILECTRATRQWTGANTNLGIVLLLAPLCRAAALGGELRASLGRVLANTTVEDARLAYTAIRASGAGGLGTAESQDLREVPTVPLTEAMALAAERDAVAREYATGFRITFETGWPAVQAARAAGLTWDEVTVEGYLAILATTPDTLIARKRGPDEARAVSARAAEVQAAGGCRTPEGRALLALFDAGLRDPQNSLNPGTTADLTAAALLVSLLRDGWPSDPSRTPRAQ